jgi:hypothetical protein
MTTTTAARAGRPRVVEAAFLLLLALIAVDVVTWALGMFVIAPTGLDEMRAAAGPEAGLRQAAVSGAFTAVIAAVGVVLAVLIRRGRNWARLVLVGIAALVVLLDLATITMDGPPWAGMTAFTAISTIAPALLALAALVLLFLPTANPYFRRSA